jgi:hypothetical protein
MTTLALWSFFGVAMFYRQDQLDEMLNNDARASLTVFALGNSFTAP